MKLYLAPMEGVTDWLMRDTLTQLGGIDFCVTEFLRVTKNLHPKKVFIRHCPELLTQSKTRSGVPVFFQLLGGDASAIADNAHRAAELGAAGIDLNFGCPAKTVNRHDGGAILLKSPHRLFDITKKVRESVSSTTPVSAKIRLGYEDTSLCKENAIALQEAGAEWITVHCRTKLDGYRPPAHWHWIPLLSELIKIPIIANGDIQSLESFETCRKATQVENFMIGRSSLIDPFLFTKIKSVHPLEGSTNSLHHEWSNIENILHFFFLRAEEHINAYFATSRTKQWLKSLSFRYPQAKILFDLVKIHRSPSVFKYHLLQNLHTIHKNTEFNEVKHNDSSQL